jgi:hypothetical protein
MDPQESTHRLADIAAMARRFGLRRRKDHQPQSL